MRNISQLVVSMMLLAAQAASPVPAPAAASTAPVAVEVPVVTLNTNSPQPVAMVEPVRPDFDRDQLAPLRTWQAAQAAAAAQVAAEAAARARVAEQMRLAATVVVPSVQAPATADNMLALRLCESGNTYTRNSGNGYYGAYQYDLSTWNNYDGYSEPDLAPASVQDAKFLETFSQRGWSPWPACSAKLGL